MSTDGAALIPSADRAWDLLLATSSPHLPAGGVARLRPLVEEAVDWEALLRLVDHHGTSSLAYQNLAQLGDMVPLSVAVALRERYEMNVRRSLFLARELIRILDCLDELGIEVIPYKGLALSEVYYGDMALRQPGDIDLFVRRQDVARIKKQVLELGYTARVTIPEDAREDHFDSGYECTFDSPAGKNLLELQWALQPRFYAVDFDMEGLFERAVNVTVAGRVMRTPSTEDLLLVLALHAAKHVWERLIWLCDIAQILRRDNLNWDWVQSQAQEIGIVRILHITLLLTQRFVGTPVPASIEQAIIADQTSQALAQQVASAVIAGVSYEEQQVAYFRLMMRLRERRLDRMRFLTRLAFTPGPGEWDTIRLPKILFPLYRVVRLARLAGRFARS